MKEKMLLCCWMALLLAACAADPDNTTYYLLSDSNAPDPVCSAQLGTVAMPGYLNKSNIAIQGDGNQLIYANTHRWAEPLSNAVKRQLGACLGNGEQPTIDVSIDHFHGATNGKTVLAGSWRVRGVDPTRAHHDTIEQRQAGYDALVDSQRALIQGLCRRICSDLAQTEPPPHP